MRTRDRAAADVTNVRCLSETKILLGATRGVIGRLDHCKSPSSMVSDPGGNAATATGHTTAIRTTTSMLLTSSGARCTDSKRYRSIQGGKRDQIPRPSVRHLSVTTFWSEVPVDKHSSGGLSACAEETTARKVKEVVHGTTQHAHTRFPNTQCVPHVRMREEQSPCNAPFNEGQCGEGHSHAVEWVSCSMS